jgi:hypothetical protein
MSTTIAIVTTDRHMPDRSRVRCGRRDPSVRRAKPRGKLDSLSMCPPYWLRCGLRPQWTPRQAERLPACVRRAA